MKNPEVHEIFFSLEGEGMLIGVPTTFVRLSRCPIRCRWCDEPGAFEPGTVMTIEEILTAVRAHPAKVVCVTGGEPLAQAAAVPLIHALMDEGYRVVVETGGSVSIEGLPDDDRLCVSLDVKCPASGMHERMHVEEVGLLRPKDQLKFVIADRRDYEYAKKVMEDHPVECEVIMQPEGGKDLRELAEWVLADGLNVRVLPQLHKLMWEDTRGR